MTTPDGHCCGNCDAFMPDPFNWGEQGACAVIDDDCVRLQSYWWTMEEGDCPNWTPRKRRSSRTDAHRRQSAEMALYERRMKGDWS